MLRYELAAHFATTARRALSAAEAFQPGSTSVERFAARADKIAAANWTQGSAANACPMTPGWQAAKAVLGQLTCARAGSGGTNRARRGGDAVGALVAVAVASGCRVGGRGAGDGGAAQRVVACEAVDGGEASSSHVWGVAQPSLPPQGGCAKQEKCRKMQGSVGLCAAVDPGMCAAVDPGMCAAVDPGMRSG